MGKKIFFGFIFALILLFISLVASEFIFRALIFSKSNSFKSLRDPGKYSQPCLDDYWKLYYRFNGRYPPPANPHPLLGWVGFFDRETLEHRDFKKSGNKRKVLLYGDSFTMCISDSIQCFEEILNTDTAFTRNNFLLNYGVGGYGVDQMYLLFSQTVDKFKNPFVIINIMPGDMDRGMLEVRTGQKPHFIIENEELKLKGVPIDSNPQHYFEANPPKIISYMWNRFTHSSLNPNFDSLDASPGIREEMVKVNRKIILQAYSEIKKRNLEYVFVIYDELYNREGSWRTDSLQKILTDNNIFYIHTGDLVNEDIASGQFSFYNYILAVDGHPTSHYNKILCAEIKKYVLSYPAYAIERQKFQKSALIPNSVAYYEREIRLDKSWMDRVREKALKWKIPLDSAIHLDAIYMVEQNKLKE